MRFLLNAHAGRHRCSRPARFAALGAGLLVLAAGSAHADDGQRQRLLREGAVLYDRYCVGCHGEQGDGQGPAARLLVTKPRDFTSGIYKFRSTPTGTLPTDEDLYRTLTRGVYGTSMPNWALLPERARLALVEYVKTFYPAWDAEGPGDPIFIPQPPAWFGSDDAIARGAELYDMLGCASCHGESGRGDGESADTLDPDAWGNAQRPFDFTSGPLHGGPTPRDVYRTFMTGIYGTAMPSYYDIFGEPDGEYIFEGDAWRLVSYIISLRRTERHSTVRWRMPEAEETDGNE